MSSIKQSMVTGYTISYAFDTYKNGSKSSHLVAMTFSTCGLVCEADAEKMAFLSSMMVTRASVYQALSRGSISINEANEFLTITHKNHEKICTVKFNLDKDDDE